MSYISESQAAVLQATKIAYAILKRPVTLSEIQEAASVYKVNSPYTKLTSQKEGGYTVFSFPDRILKALKSLALKDQVVVEKLSRVWVAEPIEPLIIDPTDLVLLQTREVESSPMEKLLGRLKEGFPEVERELDAYKKDLEFKRDLGLDV